MDCYLVEKDYAGLETGHLEVFGKTGDRAFDSNITLPIGLISLTARAI
jgi:hypothetical protein